MKYIDKFKEYCFNNLLDYDLFNVIKPDDFYKYLKLEYRIHCIKQDINFNLYQKKYRNKISKQNKILSKYDLVKDII